MRKPVLAANWKMNHGPAETARFFGDGRLDLLLLNDDDLTYAKVRLDERSLATLATHLSDIADPLARNAIHTACSDPAAPIAGAVLSISIDAKMSPPSGRRVSLTAKAPNLVSARHTRLWPPHPAAYRPRSVEWMPWARRSRSTSTCPYEAARALLRGQHRQ